MNIQMGKLHSVIICSSVSPLSSFPGPFGAILHQSTSWSRSFPPFLITCSHLSVLAHLTCTTFPNQPSLHTPVHFLRSLPDCHVVFELWFLEVDSWSWPLIPASSDLLPVCVSFWFLPSPSRICLPLWTACLSAFGSILVALFVPPVIYSS